MSERARRDPYGPALVLLGVLALGRAWVLSAPPLTVGEVGEPVRLDPYALSGDEFRLLPGVGPVLAGRLEAARQAAGGRLDEQRLTEIPGVGPGLAARWGALRTR